MRRNCFFPFFIFLFIANITNGKTIPLPAPIDSQKLYQEMQLNNVILYPIFEKAIIGYNKINPKNREVITLIDFSKPSDTERLYVLNVVQKKILYASYVSHGRNSGENFATSFSNQEGSYKSSLGFFITGNTYEGKNGYSLILDGLEKGINDKAKKRAIVVHGADYSDPSVISASGRLGRSLGCPALPKTVSKQIIDLIKDGSLLFIYANDKNYIRGSGILDI